MGKTLAQLVEQLKNENPEEYKKYMRKRKKRLAKQRKKEKKLRRLSAASSSSSASAVAGDLQSIAVTTSEDTIESMKSAEITASTSDSSVPLLEEIDAALKLQLSASAQSKVATATESDALSKVTATTSGALNQVSAGATPNSDFNNALISMPLFDTTVIGAQPKPGASATSKEGSVGAQPKPGASAASKEVSVVPIGALVDMGASAESTMCVASKEKSVVPVSDALLDTGASAVSKEVSVVPVGALLDTGASAESTMGVASNSGASAGGSFTAEAKENSTEKGFGFGMYLYKVASDHSSIPPSRTLVKDCRLLKAKGDQMLEAGMSIDDMINTIVFTEGAGAHSDDDFSEPFSATVLPPGGTVASEVEATADVYCIPVPCEYKKQPCAVRKVLADDEIGATQSADTVTSDMIKKDKDLWRETFAGVECEEVLTFAPEQNLSSADDLRLLLRLYCRKLSLISVSDDLLTMAHMVEVPICADYKKYCSEMRIVAQKVFTSPLFKDIPHEITISSAFPFQYQDYFPLVVKAGHKRMFAAAANFVTFSHLYRTLHVKCTTALQRLDIANPTRFQTYCNRSFIPKDLELFWKVFALGTHPFDRTHLPQFFGWLRHVWSLARGFIPLECANALPGDTDIPFLCAQAQTDKIPIPLGFLYGDSCDFHLYYTGETSLLMRMMVGWEYKVEKRTLSVCKLDLSDKAMSQMAKRGIKAKYCYHPLSCGPCCDLRRLQRKEDPEQVEEKYLPVCAQNVGASADVRHFGDLFFELLQRERYLSMIHRERMEKLHRWHVDGLSKGYPNAELNAFLVTFLKDNPYNPCNDVAALCPTLCTVNDTQTISHKLLNLAHSGELAGLMKPKTTTAAVASDQTEDVEMAEEMADETEDFDMEPVASDNSEADSESSGGIPPERQVSVSSDESVAEFEEEIADEQSVECGDERSDEQSVEVNDDNIFEIEAAKYCKRKQLEREKRLVEVLSSSDSDSAQSSSQKKSAVAGDLSGDDSSGSAVSCSRKKRRKKRAVAGDLSDDNESSLSEDFVLYEPSSSQTKGKKKKEAAVVSETELSEAEAVVSETELSEAEAVVSETELSEAEAVVSESALSDEENNDYGFYASSSQKKQKKKKKKKKKPVASDFIDESSVLLPPKKKKKKKKPVASDFIDDSSVLLPQKKEMKKKKKKKRKKASVASDDGVSMLGRAMSSTERRVCAPLPRLGPTSKKVNGKTRRIAPLQRLDDALATMSAEAKKLLKYPTQKPSSTTIALREALGLRCGEIKHPSLQNKNYFPADCVSFIQQMRKYAHNIPTFAGDEGHQYSGSWNEEMMEHLCTVVDFMENNTRELGIPRERVCSKATKMKAFSLFHLSGGCGNYKRFEDRWRRATAGAWKQTEDFDPRTDGKPDQLAIFNWFAKYDDLPTTGAAAVVQVASDRDDRRRREIPGVEGMSHKERKKEKKRRARKKRDKLRRRENGPRNSLLATHSALKTTLHELGAKTVAQNSEEVNYGSFPEFLESMEFAGDVSDALESSYYANKDSWNEVLSGMRRKKLSVSKCLAKLSRMVCSIDVELSKRLLVNTHMAPIGIDEATMELTGAPAMNSAYAAFHSAYRQQEGLHTSATAANASASASATPSRTPKPSGRSLASSVPPVRRKRKRAEMDEMNGEDSSEDSDENSGAKRSDDSEDDSAKDSDLESLIAQLEELPKTSKTSEARDERSHLKARIRTKRRQLESASLASASLASTRKTCKKKTKAKAKAKASTRKKKKKKFELSDMFGRPTKKRKTSSARQSPASTARRGASNRLLSAGSLARLERIRKSQKKAASARRKKSQASATDADGDAVMLQIYQITEEEKKEKRRVAFAKKSKAIYDNFDRKCRIEYKKTGKAGRNSSAQNHSYYGEGTGDDSSGPSLLPCNPIEDTSKVTLYLVPDGKIYKIDPRRKQLLKHATPSPSPSPTTLRTIRDTRRGHFTR